MKETQQIWEQMAELLLAEGMLSQEEAVRLKEKGRKQAVQEKEGQNAGSHL